MKFTLSWLKDHLDTDAPLETIVDAMVRVGLEVETVEDPGARLAAFTIGEVIEAEKHPEADKLKVCKVATKDGVLQIVCGAPNARVGLKVAYAPVGAYVPGIDVTLTKAKIRGVESHGMMCSARELELGDDHDGIIEAPGDAEIGAPVAAVLGADDPAIDFEVTPNRPDTNGVGGVARDRACPRRLRLPNRDPPRFPVRRGERLPRLRRPAHSRRSKRAFAGLAAAAPEGDRPQAHQCARRRHQLSHL
jgi:phenylalanyl-tRNA synthetase beta chain